MQHSPYVQGGSLESQDYRTVHKQRSFNQPSQPSQPYAQPASAGVASVPQPRAYGSSADTYYAAPGPGFAGGLQGQSTAPSQQPAISRRSAQQPDWQASQASPGSARDRQPSQQSFSAQVPGQYTSSSTSPAYSHLSGSPMGQGQTYLQGAQQGQTYSQTPTRSPQMSPVAHSASATYAQQPLQHQSSQQEAYFGASPSLGGGGFDAPGNGAAGASGGASGTRATSYSPSQYAVGNGGTGGSSGPTAMLPHRLTTQAAVVAAGQYAGYSPRQQTSQTSPSPATYSTYSPASPTTGGGGGVASSMSPYMVSAGGHGPLPRGVQQLVHQDPGASSMASSTATATTEHYYGSRSGSVLGGLESTIRQQREEGFRRVRTIADLRPIVNAQPGERRVDPNGGFISPLKALTTHLAQTYHLINPEFKYELSFNPRRVLTKPSKPAGNDGKDNEEADYILYVNDLLGTEEGHKYLILDVLGQGTFGQVVKCQNLKTHEILAVKVIKNKPAYFNQSMMEVTILEMLNRKHDPEDKHHLLRMKDHFIHHKHLCIAFELLSSNLYELIKQNSFRGLSTSLVRVFTSQLLDALEVLNEAHLIHCDLKPENILLTTLSSPDIKVIDFGSACHEKQTVYTYIQSRFYRSPEVILGLPYSSSIDMWSLGCICVELFLGLPLFPGTSEYNQITRIVEMLGMPPQYMLEVGKQSSQFFDVSLDEFGQKSFRLKSLEKYSKEHNVQEQPSKKYFQQDTLEGIISQYPVMRKGMKPNDLEKEKFNRLAFIDFVKGLLKLSPIERWTPQQARLHPFIQGKPLSAESFRPPKQDILVGPSSGHHSHSQPSATDHTPMDLQSAQAPPKQTLPYGGLPPGPTSSGQKYDAAQYAQIQAQQQTYTAQVAYQRQQQREAAQRSQNPYALPPPIPGASGQQGSSQAMQQGYSAAPRLQQTTQGAQGGSATSAFYAARGSASGPLSAGLANPPPASHQYARHRSGTVNEMDSVPVQLQRRQVDLANYAGQSVTPVLRREDQLAWEQRQAHNAGGLGRRISHRNNPQLDYLHEQAEMGWHQRARIPLPQQNYYAGTSQPFAVVVDGDRRANPQQLGHAYDAPTNAGMGQHAHIAAPPQAHTNATRYVQAPNAPNAYASGSGTNGPSNNGSSGTGGGSGGYDVSIDTYDHRDGSQGMAYVPMVPKQTVSGAVISSTGPSSNPGPGGYYLPPPVGLPQQQQVGNSVNSNLTSGSGAPPRIPDNLLAAGPRSTERRPSVPEWGR